MTQRSRYLFALFEWQLDIAADRSPAGLARAAIGGLHHAGAAAGHHGEAQLRERVADLARQRIVAVVFVEARRAKHRHAGSDEMQGPESADEIASGAQQEDQFLGSGMGPFEE